MINFTDEYIRAKNEMATGYAWIRLLKLTVSNGDTYLMTDNNEDVVYNSETYNADLPFKIDILNQSSKGDIVEYRISVVNVARKLTSVLENYNGLVDSTVELMIVRSDLLGLLPAITEKYTVVKSSYNAETIDLVLGKENLYRKVIPNRRFLKNFCNHKFKSVECGYAGVDETCNKTFGDCKAKGNESRFGGFPSIPFGVIVRL